MIKTLNTRFAGLEENIACFLMETDDGPVLFETGPHSTLPELVKEINKAGYQKEDVKHVFPTHIHLDHAGAAWAFAEHGATIYFHPKGVKHMVDPTRLLDSAKRIYKDRMDELWGTLKPIPGDQIVEVEDNLVYTVGGVDIKALFTPGHAVHHVSWEIGDELIAGDVCGVQIAEGGVVPPCPPPDINVEDWLASIARIKANNYKALYLTHFDRKENVASILDELEACILDWADFTRKLIVEGVELPEVMARLGTYADDAMRKEGVSEETIRNYHVVNPPSFSAAGLYRYWSKKLA